MVGLPGSTWRQLEDTMTAATLDQVTDDKGARAATGSPETLVVETPQQLERLRDLGCDQAQGFFFARPMGARDVPAAIGHPAW